MMNHGHDDDDETPVYRSIPAGAMRAMSVQQAASSQADGGSLRDFGAAAFGAGAMPAFSSLSTTTTGYDDNEPVYRSLMVAPPMLERAAAAPSGLGIARDGFGPGLTMGQSGFAPKVGRAPPKAAPGSDELKPMPHPFTLDPDSFCVLRGDVKKIVETVTEVLRQNEVDFAFKPSKCKWKGCTYVRNWCLDIRVFLFEGNWESDMFALEFQRRRGCAMHFAQLFRQARAELVRRGCVCSEDGEFESPASADTAAAASKASGGLRVPSLGFFPPEVPGWSKPKLTSDSLEPLYDMACSEFIEMQYQAVREIANLAAEDDGEGCPVIAAFPGLVGHLVQCVGSADHGLHRCAAAVLSNLTANATCCGTVVSVSGVVAALVALCERDGVELEARRQCVSALANICAGGFTSDVCKCDRAIPVINECLCHEDERLQKAAVVARNLLPSC